MAKKLDPKIAEVLKEHGHGPEACWDCHGTWVVYHRVLEQIAASANIRYDDPQIIEANGGASIAALSVRGWLGERSEWSIGEASPKNNKNAYPWAMAEKRAKDRVVLKLIGLHGLAYSEEEADDFKNSAPKQEAEPAQPEAKPAAKQEQKPAPDRSNDRDYAFEWLENSAKIGLENMALAWPNISAKYKSAPFIAELTARKDELKAQLTKEAA